MIKDPFTKPPVMFKIPDSSLLEAAIQSLIPIHLRKEKCLVLSPASMPKNISDAIAGPPCLHCACETWISPSSLAMEQGSYTVLCLLCIGKVVQEMSAPPAKA